MLHLNRLIAISACLAGLSIASPVLAAASTDLGVAASTGDTGRIKALLGQGQNINVRDGEGYTPIMWAALNGQVNAVSTLLTLGANLNVQDSEGYTALMWATQNKHTTVVRQLVNAGASVNLRDNHGYAALHWAAQDGQLAAAQMLLQRGADPNVRDIEGYTPLMWAAQQGHSAVVYELLAHNANIGFRDKRGYTATDLANAYYHPEIKRMIATYRAKPAYAAAQVGEWREPGVQVVPLSTYVPVVRSVDTRSILTAGNRVYYRGDDTLQPIAVIQPRRIHARPVFTTSRRVPVRSGVKPKLVAVVTTPDSPYLPQTPMTYQPPASIKSAWWGTALQSRLAKYDVDRNQTIDGRDWRNLTMTTSRIALAQMLYESRSGKKGACTPAALAQIMNKLDWVYGQGDRSTLTLNQAWDLPSTHFENIRW